MYYSDTAFWWVNKAAGMRNLYGEILTRKLQLVYVHWTGLGLALILLLVVLVVLVARTQLPPARTARQPDGSLVLLVPRAQLPPLAHIVTGIWLLALYVPLGGATFFSAIDFSHAMLRWPLWMYVVSALYSWTVAAAPVVLLYFVQNSRPERRDYRVAYLAVIPVVHSLMATVYLLSPYWGIE